MTVPSDTTLATASAHLRTGNLVAFPTETVYGLGADARQDSAVAKIFAAKHRPTFNPLIVHVASLDHARAYGEFSPEALDLAQAFWPGPLTLVLPRSPDCALSLLVSAGLNTIALRVPAHPLAQALLAESSCPIAAPSANRSGDVSPTQAQHVRDSLGRDSAPLILDGGPCTIGLESTILDLTGPRAELLRHGGVSQEDLQGHLGYLPAPAASEDPDKPKSPGRLLSHYAPRAPVRLDRTEAAEGGVLLGFGGTAGATFDLSPSGDTTEAAAHLFAALRRLDADHPSEIAVAPIPERGLGRAIRDRLHHAAAPRSGALPART